MKTIIVFPGQGSQRVGMARDFYEQHAAARAVFDEASDALNYDLARLCFEDHERIHLTEFTQPAIVTAEIAINRIGDTIAVPNQALFKDGEVDWVLVRDGGGFERRDVELGVRGANRSQVLGGLQAGEQIALFPPAGQES